VPAILLISAIAAMPRSMIILPARSHDMIEGGWHEWHFPKAQIQSGEGAKSGEGAGHLRDKVRR
jgi:hypothetical protein